MDEDVAQMGREELVAEVLALRAAIRTHRDSSGHDLCWHHPDLWGTLPERVDPEIAVPPWPRFMRGCVAYRQSLDDEAPGAATHDAEYDDRTALIAGGRCQHLLSNPRAPDICCRW